MKKFIKKLIAVAIAGSMFLTAGALLACGGGNKENGDGDNDNKGDVGANTYTFEAEYTDLTGLDGLGQSGSPTGVGLITMNKDASNGAYVSQLGEKSPITFKITSDKAAKATLKGIFGSNELSPITWTSAEFAIEVNGVSFNYTKFKTEKTTSSVQNFKLRTLGEIDLKAGENTIVFRPQNNKHLSNQTSGPSIDCIKLSTDATLTFEAHEDNLE